MFVEDLVSVVEFFEDHLLKEPCRVSDVPFWRRDIDDWLRDVVLDLERLTEFFRVRADIGIKRD